ncbi:MAG: hypothetical protein EBZ77_10185 [Chitinophagia bacterium]|nr:hypothetical protein [Chitinophagia bacterium]
MSSANITEINSKRQNRNEKVTRICRDLNEMGVQVSERQVRNILGGISGNRRVTKLGEYVTIYYALLTEAETTARTNMQRLIIK